MIYGGATPPPTIFNKNKMIKIKLIDFWINHDIFVNINDNGTVSLIDNVPNEKLHREIYPTKEIIDRMIDILSDVSVHMDIYSTENGTVPENVDTAEFRLTDDDVKHFEKYT
ncbi:hypothetical protein [Microcystis phage Mel-JY01]